MVWHRVGLLACGLGYSFTLACGSAPVAPPPVPEPAAPKPPAPARLEQAKPARAYPASRRDALVEKLHGVSVADPYRWLEDSSSAETKAWVEAQNALTQRYLGEIPRRAAIRSAS